jgi:hypothetical protein
MEGLLNMIKVLIYATSCPTPNHILSAKLLARLIDARPTIILAGTGVNNDRYLTFRIISSSSCNYNLI